MVTIKDIAARLQVSASTVGRALADDPRISASMKQRVSEVADELGYVANRAARMMRGVSSNLVGLVVPDIRNSFYSTIAHALSKCLDREGFQLTLSETDDDRAVESRQIRELVSANVVGVILVPSARPHPDSVRLLKQVPHIQLLRKHAVLGDQWFGMDDAEAIFRAVRHLMDLGHERVAYIGPPEELPTGARRLEGYRRAVAGSPAEKFQVEVLGSPRSSDFARQAVRELLGRRRAPTGVVLGSVQHTQGVLDELLTLKVSVPADLSVVGFGDEPGFRWWGPGLTTVALPVSEMATACGLWFVHQMRDKSTSPPSYNFISPPNLIVRGSTRAPRSTAAVAAPERVAR